MTNAQAAAYMRRYRLNHKAEYDQLRLIAICALGGSCRYCGTRRLQDLWIRSTTRDAKKGIPLYKDVERRPQLYYLSCRGCYRQQVIRPAATPAAKPDRSIDGAIEALKELFGEVPSEFYSS